MKSLYFVGFLGALLSLHMACGSNGPPRAATKGATTTHQRPGSGGSGIGTGMFGTGGTFGTGTGAPPCLTVGDPRLRDHRSPWLRRWRHQSGE